MSDRRNDRGKPPDDEPHAPRAAAPPTDRLPTAAEQRLQRARVALGMVPCPACGAIHPSRWARYDALGRIRPGDVVGPLCAADSPLMVRVYGPRWRVLAVTEDDSDRFPRLTVEPVEPGPWARDGEELVAEVDARHVFPVSDDETTAPQQQDEDASRPDDPD